MEKQSTAFAQTHWKGQELWHNIVPKFRTVAMFVTVNNRNILQICRYVCDLSKYYASTNNYKYGHNAKLRNYRHVIFFKPSGTVSTLDLSFLSTVETKVLLLIRYVIWHKNKSPYSACYLRQQRKSSPNLRIMQRLVSPYFTARRLIHNIFRHRATGAETHYTPTHGITESESLHDVVHFLKK